MTKDDWILEFTKVLRLELRPDYGSKLARTVALQQWVAHQAEDPVDAARRWASGDGSNASTSTPPKGRVRR